MHRLKGRIRKRDARRNGRSMGPVRMNLGKTPEGAGRGIKSIFSAQFNFSGLLQLRGPFVVPPPADRRAEVDLSTRICQLGIRAVRRRRRRRRRTKRSNAQTPAVWLSPSSARRAFPRGEGISRPSFSAVSSQSWMATRTSLRASSSVSPGAEEPGTSGTTAMRPSSFSL